MTKRTYEKSVAGRRLNLNMPEPEISKAAFIGGGNVSKGFRIAVNDYYDRMLAAKGLLPSGDNDGDATPDDDLGPNPDPSPVPAPAPTPKPSASPRPSPGFVSVAEMERRMAQPSDDGFEPMSSEGLTPGELDEMRRNARSGEPITEADFNAGKVCTLPANA